MEDFVHLSDATHGSWGMHLKSNKFSRVGPLQIGLVGLPKIILGLVTECHQWYITTSGIWLPVVYHYQWYIIMLHRKDKWGASTANFPLAQQASPNTRRVPFQFTPSQDWESHLVALVPPLLLAEAQWQRSPCPRHHPLAPLLPQIRLLPPDPLSQHKSDMTET